MPQKKSRGLKNHIKLDFVEKILDSKDIFKADIVSSNCPNLLDFVANSACHSKDSQLRYIYRKFAKFRLLVSHKMFNPNKEDQ